MATPQIPEGRCPHCQAPIVDLFAEWTDEYQTKEGKQRILAGDSVFDCYYCQRPFQLVLPLAIISPQKQPDQYHLAKRVKARCEAWLASQHPGDSLSQVVEKANWRYQDQWAFDGYNWQEGVTHHHGHDVPPTVGGIP